MNEYTLEYLETAISMLEDILEDMHRWNVRHEDVFIDQLFRIEQEVEDMKKQLAILKDIDELEPDIKGGETNDKDK